MSEKTKEKQLISSENDKKDKDIDILKAFQILKDIPLSKISFFVILYTTIFFIIPYFAYYRFLPIDSSLTSIPIKFILLGIFGFFTMLIIFSFFILGIYEFVLNSKDIYINTLGSEKNRIGRNYLSDKILLDLAVYIISLFLVFLFVKLVFLFTAGIINKIMDYIPPEMLLILILILIVIFFTLVYFLSFLVKKILFNLLCIKFKITNKFVEQNICKDFRSISLNINSKLLKTYLLQYFFFLVSIAGILVALLPFILSPNHNSNLDIFTFAVFFLVYISLFFFFSFILEDKYLPPIVFVTLLLPLLFMRLTIDKYVILLKAGYSFVGVSSNPSDSVLLCISKNSNVSVSPGIYKKRLSGEPPLILINSKKRFEDYICFRDVNVVWNGDNYVWITENEESKFLIKIPKTALLNHEVMFLPKSDTNPNANNDERKNEKDKNKK